MKDWKDIILEQDRGKPLSIIFKEPEFKEKEMNELFCNKKNKKKSTKIKPTHYKSDNDVIKFCIIAFIHPIKEICNFISSFFLYELSNE